MSIRQTTSASAHSNSNGKDHNARPTTTHRAWVCGLSYWWWLTTPPRVPPFNPGLAAIPIQSTKPPPRRRCSRPAWMNKLCRFHGIVFSLHTHTDWYRPPHHAAPLRLQRAFRRRADHGNSRAAVHLRIREPVVVVVCWLKWDLSFWVIPVLWKGYDDDDDGATESTCKTLQQINAVFCGGAVVPKWGMSGRWPSNYAFTLQY